MNSALIVIPTAALLAMAGGFFGLCLARVIWADDLKHALRLREVWKQTQSAQEGIIESQKRQIEILKRKP